MSTIANITELKANMAEFVRLAEPGEEVVVCRRGVPVARMVPISITVNKTPGKLSSISGWLDDDDPFF